MFKPDLPTEEVGAIIARFQVPALHEAHVELIEAVRSNHRKVVVLLGCAAVRVTRNNPLDFMARERMLRAKWPDLVVLPVKDNPSDHAWSRAVDEAIANATHGGSACLYGSRDSFIPHYHGKHRTYALAASKQMSGREVRQQASKEVRSEEAFRRGVVYAAYQRYPVSYQTVDVVVWNHCKPGGTGDGGPHVLLGRKNQDAKGKWRLLGGFVDPGDPSLERAAIREASEEAPGLSVHSPQYIFSRRVEDWRYRGEVDSICTVVFAAQYQFGSVIAGDDIDEVRWFALSEDVQLVPEHEPWWGYIKQQVEGMAKQVVGA